MNWNSNSYSLTATLNYLRSFDSSQNQPINQNNSDECDEISKITSCILNNM